MCLLNQYDINLEPNNGKLFVDAHANTAQAHICQNAERKGATAM